jgi:[CysO sulfur-carrier protein]-S-L-cysteine hydrolase
MRPRGDERAVARSRAVTPIEIPTGVLDAVVRHARAEAPAECCGYLVGPRELAAVDEQVPAVDAVVACRNAQADGLHPTVPERGAESGFVIAGAELLAFARSFDGPRPARVVYHSHPNARAYFSAVDRDVARAAGYPVQHLVVGLPAPGVWEAALFAWSEPGGDFVEIARWPAPVLG